MVPADGRCQLSKLPTSTSGSLGLCIPYQSERVLAEKSHNHSRLQELCTILAGALETFPHICAGNRPHWRAGKRGNIHICCRPLLPHSPFRDSHREVCLRQRPRSATGHPRGPGSPLHHGPVHMYIRTLLCAQHLRQDLPHAATGKLRCSVHD